MSDEYGFYPGGPGGVPVASGSPYANPLDAATGYDPASLNPPGRAQLGGRGPQLPPFMRTNIWPPQLLLSTNSQVAHATRTYTTGILNQAQNVQSQAVIQFDIPCIVFGMSAACINTAAPAFGVLGGANLDTFTANLEHTNEPSLVGGNGWVFDRGSSLIVQVTPLVNATQRIDFAFFAIEERGPRNLTR